MALHRADVRRKPDQATDSVGLELRNIMSSLPLPADCVASGFYYIPSLVLYLLCHSSPFLTTQTAPRME